MDLFISESTIGTHIPPRDAFDIRVVSFTFRTGLKNLFVSEGLLCDEVSLPSVGRPGAFTFEGVDAPYDVLQDKYGGDVVSMLMRERESMGGGLFIMAHDADPAGDLMAAILRMFLVCRGVSPSEIVRMSLTYSGTRNETVFVLESFMDDVLLAEVLLRMARETRYMVSHPGTGVGLRKLFALGAVEKARRDHMDVAVVSRGVSTATYITKFLLGEKEGDKDAKDTHQTY